MTNPLNTPNHTERLNLEQLHAALHRYCLFLTQSVWDSDDLVQETWLKTLDRIQHCQHDNPEALLLRTAKNAWIDQIRRRKLWERVWEYEKERLKNDADIGSDTDVFLIEAVFQFLMVRLSPLQRTVLVLRSLLGYSVADTADKLNTTTGAVKAAYHRARKVLEDAEYEDIEESHLQEEWDTATVTAISEAYLDGDVEEMIKLVHGQEQVLNMIGGYDSIGCQVTSTFYTSYNQPMMRMTA